MRLIAVLACLFLITSTGACNQDTLPPDEADGYDGGTDGGSQACTTHTDCTCREGICLSTGECWCPPCEGDEDCPAGQVCRSGSCVESCAGPLRVSPDHGPTSGGTLITFEGQEYYIGALEWFARIGDGPWLMPLYGDYANGLPCSLTFISPPMPAGSYPAYVLYGFPPFGNELPEEGYAGTFTYETSDETVGHGFCRGPAQCESPVEICDLGLGRCVTDMCASLFCSDFLSLCDPIQGCLPEAFRCQTSQECKLIRSSCGCQAVHVNDRRGRITSCTMGGCDSCEENHCDTENVEAVCIDGACSERRGDLRGVSCESLEFEERANQLRSGSWIRSVRATDFGERVALTWMQPADSPHYRYGSILVALIDTEGVLQSPISTLDTPRPNEHSPSVASDGSSLGVVWVSEFIMPGLQFQSIDQNGTPAGAPRQLFEPLDSWHYFDPLLFGDSAGYHLVWSQHETIPDGLNHVELTRSGEPAGNPGLESWIRPEQEQFRVFRIGDQLKIAWRSRLYGLQGLMLSDLPVSESPVWFLSKEGAAPDVVSTGQGFGIAWSETVNEYGTFKHRVYFQSFDQDSQPLCEPVKIHERGSWLTAPRIGYLGGIFLVSWLEQDGYDDLAPRQLMAVQVGEDGRLVSGVVTVTSGSIGYVNFQVRLGSEILAGYNLTGEVEDSLNFVRWDCAN